MPRKPIFSDDPNAIGELKSRITGIESELSNYIAVNAAHKSFLKNPATLDAASLTGTVKEWIRSYKPAYSWEPHPVPQYLITNARANLKLLKHRLASLEGKSPNGWAVID